MSFRDAIAGLRSLMVQTPLGRAAAVIAQATEEFEEAIREGSDKDLCCSPESFELVPEPPEDEGGLDTGGFIMRCETDSNYTNMAAEWRAVLAPLMLKWGVSCIEVATVEQDTAMLEVAPTPQLGGERLASEQPSAARPCVGGCDLCRRLDVR